MKRFSASLAVAAICVAVQTGVASAVTGDAGLKQDPAAGRYYQSAMEKTPAMYWRLDEASGTTVHDASGNDRTGTINGTVDYQQAGGTADAGDKAISLDGSSGYVRADSYAPFVPGSSRTFVLLLKRDSLQNTLQGGIRNIFGGSGTYVAGVSDDMRFPVLEFAGAPAPSYRWYGSIARQFPFYNDWPKATVAGKWMQIVLTVDDTAGISGLKLWVNGIPLGSPTVGFNVTSGWDAEAGRFMFGIRFDGGGGFQADEWADSTYDEVAIFERVLSDAEIQDLAVAALPIITVNLGGSGTGSVTGPGFSCPGDCTGTYAQGTSLTLDAAGTGGSTFAGWGGACSGTGRCVLTMDADKTVSADFLSPVITPPPSGPGAAPPSGPAAGPTACKGIAATILGTDGSDVLNGTHGKDVILGLEGNDKLSGLAGNDLICGGAGKDTLKGGKGADTVLGQKGEDTLKGGPGKDILKGGAGRDKQVQ